MYKLSKNETTLLQQSFKNLGIKEDIEKFIVVYE